MLDDLKMIHTRDSSDMLGQAAKRTAAAGIAADDWLPEVPTAKNQAKQLALELMGRSVAIYSGPALRTAGQRWKTAINSYAKQLAWANEYSVENLSELTAWTAQPVDKPYAVVELHSLFDDSKIRRLTEAAGRFLSGRRPEPLVIEAVGKTLAQQQAWAAALGEYVAIYLALLNGIDPAALVLEEKIKKALEE